MRHYEHIKEFEDSKTCEGWSLKQSKKLDETEYWSVKLKFKDVEKKASLKEQIAIIIADLGLYNNHFLLEKECLDTAEFIINFIKKSEL